MGTIFEIIIIVLACVLIFKFGLWKGICFLLKWMIRNFLWGFILGIVGFFIYGWVGSLIGGIVGTVLAFAKSTKEAKHDIDRVQ